MIKKMSLILISLFVLGTGALAAQDAYVKEVPLAPMSPEILGQGGSYTSIAHGYNALFTNPAGFAAADGSLTLLSLNPWVYANPLRVLGSISEGTPEAMIAGINTELTTGGFGFGGSMGVGLVGHGLGLGAVFVLDTYMYGKNLLGVEGNGHVTVALIGGYAVSLNLLGFDVLAGVAVRPMARIRVPLPNSAILDLLTGGDMATALNSVNALHGFGMGIDAGVIASLGPFKGSISLRDIGGTRLSYNESPFGDIMASIGSDTGMPEGTPVDIEHIIPMDVTVGFAFDPDGGFLFDPVFHADLRDFIGVVQENKSIWTLLHIGAEASILQLFKVRAGLNQGYITMGAGVKLLFADLNLAFFTRELGRHIKDRPNSGATIELAVRF
jgi:hypothetical protein